MWTVLSLGKEEDGSYTAVARNRVINVCKENEFVVFRNVTEEEFHDVWRGYFDLDTDYGQIKKTLSEHDRF